MDLYPLISLDDRLLTSYLPRGRGTRIDGRVPDDDQVLTVGAILRGRGRQSDHSWKLAPRAAADLLALHLEVLNAAGRPLRITEARRLTAVQARSRHAYERWARAGKPSPSSSRFNRQLMKAAYVAIPGYSWHGCGKAIDIDVDALEFPGTGQGTDAALATFWELASMHGYEPVIRYPQVGQSESWHFDHRSGMDDLGDLFSEHGHHRNAYGLVAYVAHFLCGQNDKRLSGLNGRYIQARLLAGGHWCGLVDGIIGPKTVAALGAAVGTPVTRNTPVGQLLGLINERKIGTAFMAAV